MSELNVMCSPDFSDHDLNGRALDEDASLDLSLFPGLGRGPEDKLVSSRTLICDSTRLVL